MAGVELFFLSIPGFFLVFQRCVVHGKPLDGVHTTHSDKETQPQLLLGQGWPCPSLQQLIKGQNLDPSSCSCASLQGAHNRSTSPSNTSLVPGLPHRPPAPFLPLPLGVQSHHLPAALSEGQEWAHWRALTNTFALLCQEKLKHVSQSFQLPLFSYGSAGKALWLSSWWNTNNMGKKQKHQNTSN